MKENFAHNKEVLFVDGIYKINREGYCMHGIVAEDRHVCNRFFAPPEFSHPGCQKTGFWHHHSGGFGGSLFPLKIQKCRLNFFFLYCVSPFSSIKQKQTFLSFGRAQGCERLIRASVAGKIRLFDHYPQAGT